MIIPFEGIVESVAHNETTQKIFNNYYRWVDFYEDLTQDEKSAIDYLNGNESVVIYFPEGNILFLINCNDVFCLGSDAENFTPKDFINLKNIHEEFEEYGMLAWVSLKRGVMPLHASILNNEMFKNAYSKLSIFH